MFGGFSGNYHNDTYTVRLSHDILSKPSPVSAFDSGPQQTLDTPLQLQSSPTPLSPAFYDSVSGLPFPASSSHGESAPATPARLPSTNPFDTLWPPTSGVSHVSGTSGNSGSRAVSWDDTHRSGDRLQHSTVGGPSLATPPVPPTTGPLFSSSTNPFAHDLRAQQHLGAPAHLRPATSPATSALTPASPTPTPTPAFFTPVMQSSLHHSLRGGSTGSPASGRLQSTLTPDAHNRSGVGSTVAPYGSPMRPSPTLFATPSSAGVAAVASPSVVGSGGLPSTTPASDASTLYFRGPAQNPSSRALSDHGPSLLRSRLRDRPEARPSPLRTEHTVLNGTSAEHHVDESLVSQAESMGFSRSDVLSGVQALLLAGHSVSDPNLLLDHLIIRRKATAAHNSGGGGGGGTRPMTAAAAIPSPARRPQPGSSSTSASSAVSSGSGGSGGSGTPTPEVDLLGFDVSNTVSIVSSPSIMYAALPVSSGSSGSPQANARAAAKIKELEVNPGSIAVRLVLVLAGHCVRCPQRSVSCGCLWLSFTVLANSSTELFGCGHATFAVCLSLIRKSPTVCLSWFVSFAGACGAAGSGVAGA